MIRVVVNDASCLIDLNKVGLLPAMLTLPYRFIVPLPIRYSEMLDLTDEDWQRLDEYGLETFDLPGDLVAEVVRLAEETPGLSANDCFCLVSALHLHDSVLLTGDLRLRQVARAAGLRVHGVLWIIHHLHAAGVCGVSRLAAALETWREDRTVFLPRKEIDSRLRSMRGLADQ
ncbi:MAG: type II toxin-antitoxin system VapC family toxin [Chloroflexi bacterium]|nr:type II toxin-antitoxin system VapC family toxin [Chloroflexota bacterium]